MIPHDSHTKLIDGLSEDAEDHPVSFIPIIERHNDRFEKAYLPHEATRPTIEQKWAEGVTLKDIGKFLYSWAPEPYKNKPMPRGMIQALLLIAPNSQTWTPRDLSNCIILHNDTLRWIGSDTHLPQNENPPQHQKRLARRRGTVASHP